MIRTKNSASLAKILPTITSTGLLQSLPKHQLVEIAGIMHSYEKTQYNTS